MAVIDMVGRIGRSARPGVLAGGVPLLLLLGLLILGPLANIAWKTVAADGGAVWGQVVASRLSPNLLYKPLANTLILGVGVSIGTIAIGGFLAWLVVLTDVPFRRTIGVLATLPFMIPSFAVALAWSVLFRNGRVGGGGFFHDLGFAVPDALAWGLGPVLIVQTAHYYSLVFALIAAALASINSDLLEAAQMTGASKRRVLLGIALPIVTPAVIAGASLAFASAVSNFAVPALLGLPVRMQTLSTRLFGMIETGQTLRGFALSLILIVVAGVFLWVGNRLLAGRRSFSTITGKGGRSRRFQLGAWRWPLFGAAALICLLTTIVPMAILVASSLTARKGGLLGEYTLHFWTGISDPSIAQGQPGIIYNDAIVGAIATTIGLGLVVALLATALGLVIALFVARYRGSLLAETVGQLSFVPLFIPGIAFGAAYIALFGRPIGPFPALYGTFALLVITATAYLLPFAVQSGRSVVSQVGGELEDSARMTGASFLRRLWAIFLPLTARGVIAGGLLVFVKILRDLSLVVLLFTPATPVLSVVAFRYASEGFLQFANAITVIILAISVVATVIAQRLQHRVQPWMTA